MLQRPLPPEMPLTMQTKSPKNAFCPLTAGLLAMLLAACQTTTREPEAFATIDTDRDGRLSVEEVETHGFRQIFDRLDKDSDELITREDLRDGSSNVLRERDLNRDDKVTREEYALVGRRLGVVRKFYMAADADGDGYVTRAEQQNYAARGRSSD